WTISVEVPASTLGYSEFSITDNLSEGLDFVAWESIEIDGNPLSHTVSSDGDVVTFDEASLEVLSEGGTLTAVIVTKVQRAGIHTNVATISINGKDLP